MYLSSSSLLPPRYFIYRLILTRLDTTRRSKISYHPPTKYTTTQPTHSRIKCMKCLSVISNKSLSKHHRFSQEITMWDYDCVCLCHFFFFLFFSIFLGFSLFFSFYFFFLFFFFLFNTFLKSVHVAELWTERNGKQYGFYWYGYHIISKNNRKTHTKYYTRISKWCKENICKSLLTRALKICSPSNVVKDKINEIKESKMQGTIGGGGGDGFFIMY